MADNSLDLFSSPSPSKRDNRTYIGGQRFSQSRAVLNTSKMRCVGESNTMNQGIKKEVDFGFNYVAPTLESFGPSTSETVNYEDGPSILALVSSAHSSQNSNSNLKPVFKSTRKPKKDEKTSHHLENKYAPNFTTNTKTYADPLIDDFLSPDKIERYRNQTRKPRAKQARMDDFLFKARRVDKGGREFRLHTTHEPKKGSKKKRDSIECLEVDKEEFENHKKRKREEKFDLKTSEIENLHCSLVFKTPSPKKPITKISKLHSSFGSNILRVPPNPRRPSKLESSITSNDPKTYGNRNILDESIFSSPSNSTLEETIPLKTPSPVKKTINAKSSTCDLTSFTGRTINQIAIKNHNAIKRKDTKPANSAEPQFDYLSSPITIGGSGQFNNNPTSLKQKTLIDEEAQRKQFGIHVSEREQIMKHLVDQNFIDARDNGWIDQRRAELKDGQVIRNKEMRRNLMHGAACKCCRGYYDKLNMNEDEKQEHINKISRHRYVNQALPDTPEHYWDLTLGPRDDDCECLPTQQRLWESSSKTAQKPKCGIQKWN